MTYRISTSQLAQTGIDGINKNQAIMNDIVGQISSGIRSDLDPVEKAQKLSYTVKISNEAQNVRNGETILPNLNNSETAINGISEKLIQLQETMTASQNAATYDKESTKTIVASLKTDILSLANSKDSEGNYLFAGYKSQTPAFSDLNTYNGDQGVRQVRIGDSSFANANISGNNIITKNITDAFTKMDNFINSNTPDSTMLDSVQHAISDISVQQTNLGSSIKQINDGKNLSDQLTLQNQTRLSQISDPDLASLISQLSAAKNATEASMKSYNIIQNMSLFNYI
jgi:flagellar hook-associated protein 3 FlgL